MPFETTEQAKECLVRLFPTMRFSNNAEAETRATAALLATLRAVSEFGRAIVKLAGGPAGKIECFTEVRCVDQSQTPPLELRPDGLLVVSRAGKTWRCFVEVKVGNNAIERDQVEKYLQLSKQEEVSALITISNEAGTYGGLPFTGLNKALLRTVPVIHLSWERLRSEARLLRGQDRIGDADQQWILDEWIKYVSEPTSRIVEPPSLGANFGELLTAAKENNLAGAAAAVRDVCGYWDGFLKKVADRLRADLGVDVSPCLTNAEKQDNDLRLRNLQAVVFSDGRLAGSLKVKNAASEINIDVCLAARAVRFGIEVKAPSEGRQATRVKWMTKQLGKAPPDALVHVHWDQKKLKSQARVSDLAINPLCFGRDVLGQPIPEDVQARSFCVEWTRDLQKGKGRSTAAVLEGIMSDLETFYGSVVEGLVAFVPRAPKLPVAATAETQPEQRGPAAEPIAETRPEQPEVAAESTVEHEPPIESGEVLTQNVALVANANRPSQSPPSAPPPPDRAVNE